MLVYHFEGVPRNPVTVALKNILTLGIHTKVWLYRINREMDGHEGFHLNLRLLGVMVALPFITPIIVKFQTVRRLNKMVAHQTTVPILRSRYLGWISLVPVVGQAIYSGWVQGTLNKHWFWHRREERIRLSREKIKTIASEAETEESLRARFQLEEQVRALEKEIVEETDAAAIRFGPDRWAARQAYAKRMAGSARLSRTEREAMRRQERSARHKEKADRKSARQARSGGVSLKPDGTPRDLDVDADWQPTIGLPARGPEDLDALAEREDRDLTEDEARERKAAEKALMAREKESTRLSKERERLIRARERAALRAEKDAEKAEKAAAAKKEKAAKASLKSAAKKPKAAKKGTTKSGKGKKSQPQEETLVDKTPTDKIPVQARKVKAAPRIHEAGEGPLRTLNLTCPRCGTEITGVKKRGDAPAKIKCPSCQLVGKV